MAPAVGEMETYSSRLCETLESRVSLERIVLPGKADGAPPRWWSLFVFFICAAVSVGLRHRGPDVVHGADMASWPLATVTILNRNRPALVLSGHGTDVIYPRRATLIGRLYALYLKLGARERRSLRRRCTECRRGNRQDRELVRADFPDHRRSRRHRLPDEPSGAQCLRQSCARSRCGLGICSRLV